MFIAVGMNITGEQGSRAKTPFVAGCPELVTAVLLLSLKRAICQKPGMPAGCPVKLLLQRAGQR
jgi:hypothetical protein